MSAAGKALVHRWFEDVWSGGRSDLIDELMAPHCVIHGLGPETMGPAEFKSFYQAYRGAFPDVTIRIDQSVGEGDLVAGLLDRDRSPIAAIPWDSRPPASPCGFTE